MTDNTDGFDTGIGIGGDRPGIRHAVRRAGYDEGQAGIVRRGYGRHAS